jgi:1,2-dihydroxy-3-keto-5-methylthiopentene dioxygenase
MVRAWFFNESKEDQREPHYPEPFQPVPLSYLAKLGVLYWKADPVNYEEDVVFTTVRKERNYKNHDFITAAKDKLPNYEEKLKVFFDEHIHDDEEIRFFLEGSGYFDIRDELTQKWIRIEGVAGDLLIVPAGVFHRFTLDTNDYARVMRLFQDEPKWTAHSRQLEETSKREARLRYLSMFENLQAEKPNGEATILENKAKALANYPHARVVDGKVYFSGTSCRKADNTHAGAKQKEDGTWELDIKEQTQAVLENIRWILQRSGSDLQHLITITVFLVDMKDYKGMNEVYNLYFDAEAGPARTTVAVAQLPHPNLLIEIQGVAAVAEKPRSEV